MLCCQGNRAASSPVGSDHRERKMSIWIWFTREELLLHVGGCRLPACACLVCCSFVCIHVSCHTGAGRRSRPRQVEGSAPQDLPLTVVVKIYLRERMTRGPRSTKGEYRKKKECVRRRHKKCDMSPASVHGIHRHVHVRHYCTRVVRARRTSSTSPPTRRRNHTAT